MQVQQSMICGKTHGKPVTDMGRVMQESQKMWEHEKQVNNEQMRQTDE